LDSKYSGFNNDNQNNGPTYTPTWDPMIPTYTPTPSPTFNPFATETITPTPGSPTDTITPTFTATQTGTIYTPTPTWTATPNISRASLVLLPTAYSNARDHWDGFNWDIDFTYFIGSLISQDYTKAGSSGFDSLEQINIVLLTSDWKYAWLDDHGNIPGIASGLMLSLLAQVGTTGSSINTTNQTFQVAGNELGGFYTVMSKMVAKDTAVHFGYIYGLRYLTGQLFNEDYSGLLPYLGPGLINYIGQGPPDLFYVGFSTHFWGRNWKFEIWKPDPANVNPYIFYNGTVGKYQQTDPVLFNTQIDGLPMAFNLGYERWETGYALLGYVNFRIPLLPVDAPY
jgi:hypothetical protein